MFDRLLFARQGRRFRCAGLDHGEAALQQNLSIFGNSIAFSDGLAEIRTGLTSVMSESITLSRPELLAHLASICSACDPGGFGQLLALAFRPGATAAFVGERVKCVTIKHFMDAGTLIAERLEQCCVHVAGAGNAPVRMPILLLVPAIGELVPAAACTASVFAAHC